MDRMIMPLSTAAASLATVEETLEFANGRKIKFKRPVEPGILLDLNEVHDAYQRDQYMPYWANLWPVSKCLASYLFRRVWVEGARVLELGCGLGVPGLAALCLGLDVTFSDYDETALAFAADSARLNGFTNFRAIALDWRDPPPMTFDVIIASDLLYEERLVEPLTAALDKLLNAGGIALVADQNRPYAEDFKAAMRSKHFAWDETPVGAKDKDDLGDDVRGTIYAVKRTPLPR